MEACDREIQRKLNLQNPPKPKTSYRIEQKRQSIADLILNFQKQKDGIINELKNNTSANDNFSNFKNQLKEIQQLITILQTNFNDSETKQILLTDKVNIGLAFINAEIYLVSGFGKNPSRENSEIFDIIKESLQFVQQNYLDPISVNLDSSFPSDNGFTIH